MTEEAARYEVRRGKRGRKPAAYKKIRYTFRADEDTEAVIERWKSEGRNVSAEINECIRRG